MARTLVKNASKTTPANLIINSAMDFAQRGVVLDNITSAKAYGLDRWAFFTNSGSPTPALRVEQSTGIPEKFQYSMKVARLAGNTNTSGAFIIQGVETANVIPFQGKNMVLSFYATKGANYSPTDSILVAQVQTGTGTNQDVAANYTGAVTTTMNATLTSSWQRFEMPVTFASNVTEAKVIFRANHIGTAGADDSYYITGVMLSEGSVASDFSRAGGTIQQELAMCQRYYQRISAASDATSLCLGVFQAYSATQARGSIILKTSMRSKPTMGTSSLLLNTSTGTSAGGSATLHSNGTTNEIVTVDVSGASGLVAGNASYLQTAAAVGFIEFTSEL